MKINRMMNQCLKMILVSAMTAQIALPSQAQAAITTTAAQCAAVNAGTVDTPSVVASCTGISATDPQLSQNTWIAQLQPNGPSANGQTYAQLIQTAPTPALILSGYAKMLREQIMFVPGDVNTTTPANQQTAQNLAGNQRYYSIIILAQQLLDSAITNGPSLAAALKASNYTLAWSLAKQYGLISFLVNPIGFRLLGIAPFMQSQMSAFYSAATPYWNASILGPDPYSPNVEWGTVNNLAQDAITNFNTLGDATYPDLGRFAGQRPPGSLFDKWIEPIVIMAVVAVITAGVGAAIADGVNAAIGATTDVTAASVTSGGVATTVSTTTSALGTLGTTTTVIGADLSVTTTTTSTLLGTALSVGENAAAGAIVSAAQGGNTGTALLNGVLGGVVGNLTGGLATSTSNAISGGLVNAGVSQSLSSSIANAATSVISGAATGTALGAAEGQTVTAGSVLTAAESAGVSAGLATYNLLPSIMSPQNSAGGGVDLSADATVPDYVLPSREQLTAVGSNTYASITRPESGGTASATPTNEQILDNVNLFGDPNPPTEAAVSPVAVTNSPINLPPIAVTPPISISDYLPSLNLNAGVSGPSLLSADQAIAAIQTPSLPGNLTAAEYQAALASGQVPQLLDLPAQRWGAPDPTLGKAVTCVGNTCNALLALGGNVPSPSLVSDSFIVAPIDGQTAVRGSGSLFRVFTNPINPYMTSASPSFALPSDLVSNMITNAAGQDGALYLIEMAPDSGSGHVIGGLVSNSGPGGAPTAVFFGNYNSNFTDLPQTATGSQGLATMASDAGYKPSTSTDIMSGNVTFKAYGVGTAPPAAPPTELAGEVTAEQYAADMIALKNAGVAFPTIESASSADQMIFSYLKKTAGGALALAGEVVDPALWTFSAADGLGSLITCGQDPNCAKANLAQANKATSAIIAANAGNASMNSASMAQFDLALNQAQGAQMQLDLASTSAGQWYSTNVTPTVNAVKTWVSNTVSSGATAINNFLCPTGCHGPGGGFRPL